MRGTVRPLLRVLRLSLLVVLLLVLAVFAFSNQQPVALGFWPTGTTAQMPLALAVLVAMAVGFLFGAVVLWLEGLRHRLRARQAEQRAAALEHELQGLRAGLAQAVRPGPVLPAIGD